MCIDTSRAMSNCASIAFGAVVFVTTTVYFCLDESSSLSLQRRSHG